jgi:hypothetical protein
MTAVSIIRTDTVERYDGTLICLPT